MLLGSLALCFLGLRRLKTVLNRVFCLLRSRRQERRAVAGQPLKGPLRTARGRRKAADLTTVG